MNTTDTLNHDCYCLSLDRAALACALDAELGHAGLSDNPAPAPDD